MKIAKRLTSKSAVTIPRDVRAQIGWRPGMGIDLETTNDGVILRPHVDVCRFCESVEGVRRYKDVCACEKCAKEMAEVLNG